MSRRQKLRPEEPVMSDLTILVSVEDLINLAMGPGDANTVNYKMIQTVLHILARQLRLLETKVDIRISELPSKKKKKKDDSAESPTTIMPEGQVAMPEEDRQQKLKRRKEREKAKLDKMSPAEKEKYLKEQQEEESKIARMSPQEREKYMKLKEDEERKAMEREKEQQLLESMTPEERKMYLKQKEIDDAIMKDMSPKERENYLKQREKELKELLTMSPKERERYFKEKQKEQEALLKMSPEEKKKYLKEKESKTKEVKKGKQKEVELSDDESEQDAPMKSPKDKASKNVEADEEEDKPSSKKPAKGKDKSSKEKGEDDSPAAREKGKKLPKGKDESSKEKERDLEKMSPEEREKYSEEKETIAKTKSKKAKGTSSGTSIAISEAERKKEKVSVVEKGPTTRAQSRIRTSIEVVTISQFNILADEVAELKKTAGPLPIPALPGNKKLMADIAKGSASLTDTMQAMQVAARVQAAEEGLARMAGLLTQLAASGALPDAFAKQIEQARAEMDMLSGGLQGEKSKPRVTKSTASSLLDKRKSVAIDATSSKMVRPADDSASVTTTGTSAVSGIGWAPSAVSRMSQMSTGGMRIAVTRNEMDDAIQSLREDLVKVVVQLTQGAAATADSASGTAKGISEKIEVAVKLDRRISDLFALTSDYAEQLSGFDSGLNTQMASFQEQIALMKADLKTGLATLETANNNAETAAVLELTERYMGLALDLETSATEHQHLTSFQRQLAEELRGLVSAVEMLREQKADRDEVWDGLRDKADMSRLEGLVTDQAFAETRAELDDRLELCYEKFARQETAWLQALKDLTEIADTKATIMQLLSIKSEAQEQLNAAYEKLKLLELQLGEPKAAILTRLLSKDGTCAACKVPALQEAVDKTADMPCPLPYFRAPPPDEPCVPAIPPVVIEDETVKSHACKRWVGGSHTLVSRKIPREVATKLLDSDQPVQRYTGLGTDGRVYNLTKELKPCTECNRYRTGAGDGETTCQCWPGVTDPTEDIENIEAHFY